MEGGGKRTSKSKDNEKRSSRGKGGRSHGSGGGSSRADTIEDEWAAWGLERVGVGGKYYRMIEVEEVFDDELIKTVIPPFASAFRNLNSEGFDEEDDEEPCLHIIVREDPSSGACRGFFDGTALGASPFPDWAGGGAGATALGGKGLSDVDPATASLLPQGAVTAAGGGGGGEGVGTATLSSHKGGVGFDEDNRPKKKVKGGECPSRLEEGRGEGATRADATAVQRGGRSGVTEEVGGGEQGGLGGDEGVDKKRTRKEQLRIEAMLKLFNYKQSVPERLYPGRKQSKSGF